MYTGYGFFPVINDMCFYRYTGIEDTQATNTDQQSQAELILQQLHEQAKLREQERQTVGKSKRKSSGDSNYCSLNI